MPLEMLPRLILALFFLSGSVMAGHYLFWMPFSSKSMKIGVMDMVEELAVRGHHITIVSAYDSKKKVPGIKDIVIKSDFEALVQTALGKILKSEKGADVPWHQAIDHTIEDNRQAFSHPEFQDLLAKEKIDVVCVVPFGNEGGYYLAHKKNASLALLWTGVGTVPWIHSAMANPWNVATSPLPLTGYSQDMTFPQRIVNTLATMAISAVNEFYIRPKVDALLVEVFPSDSDIPSISTMAKTSALLITHGSPFLGDGLRPIMPNTIQGALMSCKPIKEQLPKHLAEFLETAEHGVIFISFGSLISPSQMPESKRIMFVNVFKSLKQRVIWKWTGEMLDAPSNVLISSWLPQQALLAHKNLQLFISHAGAGSLQETICHKTPIVGIPINSDQPANANEAVLRGFGVKVDWASLSEASLTAAIQEVLGNPSYQEAIERLQEKILDTPQPPLEQAVWWLEYLLRHPKNMSMRSPEHELTWAQILLLDVLSLYLLALITVCCLLWALMRCCCPSRRMGKEKGE